MTSNAIQYSETRELPLESVLALYRANGWFEGAGPPLEAHPKYPAVGNR